MIRNKGIMIDVWLLNETKAVDINILLFHITSWRRQPICVCCPFLSIHWGFFWETVDEWGVIEKRETKQAEIFPNAHVK